MMNNIQRTTYNLQLLKGLALLLFVVSCLFLVAQPADAHILKTDGDIGAVIHVDPDDDPIAGQQSNLFFEFKDKSGKLAIQDCTCTATILESGKKLTVIPLNPDPSDRLSGTFSYTFPEKNVYTIGISGVPTAGNSFQPFTLTYDIRVARENEPKAENQSSILTTHIPQLIALVVVAGFVGFSLLKRKKGDTKGE